MNLFISWSGAISKSLALVFRDWISNVIQSLKPWMSSEDIGKGNRWSNEIAQKLESCQIGVICVTKENHLAPWINFEAGALSKRLSEGKVCTLLIDLKDTDIKGPLAQFQFTKVTNKDDMKKLISAINDELKEEKIDEIKLNKAFEKWWPEFEKDIEKILATFPKSSKEVIRDEKDLIEEILTMVRHIDKNVTSLWNDSHRSSLAEALSRLASERGVVNKGENMLSGMLSNQIDDETLIKLKVKE